MLLPSIPEGQTAAQRATLETHIAFLEKAEKDCNKFAERFRTYYGHTQKVCLELTKLRSWDTYQEEKLLIAREGELMHMYCQLSDEVLRIRKHLENIRAEGFAGCIGYIDPYCRCWMAVNGSEETQNGSSAWDFNIPDKRISFLDNKQDILEVGRRAEKAVYFVLGGPDDLLSTSNPNMHPGVDTRELIWPSSSVRQEQQAFRSHRYYFSE
ncbi:hypothetical protein TWF730_008497 [Orbilia blumenaviensis]|uniref:Uncharacterized protein n=1 Tax=Orbilia blumenaviensis TaxID=1796055 RepID=A0AAV9V3Q2_9PEZI